MLKKISIMAMSTFLLIGCGSGSSNDKNATNSVIDSMKNPNTLEKMKSSIVDTWNSGCEQSGDAIWSIETNSFKKDLTGTHLKKSYTENDCNANSTLEDESFNFTYLLADKVKASDNKDAYQLDLVTPDMTFFTMARIIDDNLSIANNEVNDGQSAETRANSFSDSQLMRQ